MHFPYKTLGDNRQECILILPLIPMSDSRSFPIRIPVEQDQELEHATRKLKSNKQATARLAMDIGLLHLRRIKYHLPAAVLDASAAVPQRKATKK